MKVVYERCAGLDVHKKTVVACVLTPDGASGWRRETRTFSTMTADLLALSDWLQSLGCTHVAMESTGDYWKPVFNILEATVEVLLVNAQHVKAVPGRKTDVKDAEWLAELLQHGLLRASFIPPVAQRELRDLTRYRNTFIRERATLVNRVQKVLEDANIKLGSVASNVMGVSGRAMLEALIAGDTNPERLADLAKGRLREKREQLIQALEGRVKPHHRFVLTELLCQIDSLEETITRFGEQIQHQMSQADLPFESVACLLDTIPGIARQAAEGIVAEMGVDMRRFPSADDLASWAGVAPGNHESAGKRYSGKTRKGNRTLKTLLVQVAHAAAHTKNTYLAAQYRRLAARRGKKRAILAVAHSILVMAYHMICNNEPYREAGADYFDRLRPTDTANRLKKRLEALGYQVTLEKEAIALAV
jgi:transposase